MEVAQPHYGLCVAGGGGGQEAFMGAQIKIEWKDAVSKVILGGKKGGVLSSKEYGLRYPPGSLGFDLGSF